MGISSSGGSSASSGASTGSSGAASASPSNALTMLMGMLGQQNQGGASGGGMGGAAGINPVYKPAPRGYAGAVPGAGAPSGAPPANPFSKIFPATPSTQDLSVGANAPGSVVANGLADSASAKPSTMASISNMIFGGNKASALSSASSLAGGK